LKLQKFNLKSELDLINFLDNWATETVLKRQDNIGIKDEQKIRNHLEPRILPFLRFLTLTKDEFLQFCACNWLTRSEKRLILKCIETGETPETFPGHLSNNRGRRCYKCKKKNDTCIKIK